MNPDRPCWELTERWPKFCAKLANGKSRCRKGTCSLIEAATQPSLLDGVAPPLPHPPSIAAHPAPPEIYVQLERL